MNKQWKYSSFGIPDSYFTRGNAPMTKEEARAVVMSKLRLEEDSILIDVGAGTGSVSIEAALKLTKGKVYAIEFKDDPIELIKINRENFGLDNVEIVVGRAKDKIREIKGFDRIFIGGTCGELSEILDYTMEEMKPGGRVVMTVVTIENLNRGLEGLKSRKLKDVEVVSVGISKGRSTGNYTIMEAENTIYILSATKE